MNANAYKKRKKEHPELCPVCKKKHEEGHVLCNACSAARSRAILERREKRRAEGKCIKCGKTLQEGLKYKMCFDCRLKEAEYKRKKYEKYKQERKCVACGKQLDLANGVYCSSCGEKRNQKSRERKGEKNAGRI